MLDQRLRLARYFYLHTALFCVLTFICYAEVFIVLVMPPRPFATGNGWIFALVQACNGTLFLGVGIAHGHAGRCVTKLRRRRFVIAVLGSNAFWILTICLTPTGLLLLVFGFWFMFQRDVRWAYAEVAKGRTVDEVLASSRPSFGDERDDYDDEMTHPAAPISRIIGLIHNPSECR